jgi:hypothetical protein
MVVSRLKFRSLLLRNFSAGNEIQRLIFIFVILLSNDKLTLYEAKGLKCPYELIVYTWEGVKISEESFFCYFVQILPQLFKHYF